MVQAALADTPAEKLATFGTRNTVRDIARLSAALGEERLDFLGFSYGTLTGAAFMSACPSRVGHFALDAAVPPAPDYVTRWTPEALSLDKHLNRLADLCATDASCPFHGGTSNAEILAAKKALADQLESTGGIVIGSRKIVEADLHYATREAVWSSVGTALWDALAAAENGDWAPLLALADSYWSRNPDGSYDYAGRKWGIMATDSPCPKDWTLASAKTAVAEVAKGAPELGAAMFTETFVCLHWPVLGPALTVSKTSAPPAMITGGNLDALCPGEFAGELSGLLANGSYVLMHDEPGHVGWTKNTCVTAAEIQFLLDGKQPGIAHCDAD
jgi:pimeloyl-ACP methyl ester carboxylesterase